MFWFAFLLVVYLVSLTATLVFIYSAGVLNSRADRLTEELILHLRRGPCREAA